MHQLKVTVMCHALEIQQKCVVLEIDCHCILKGPPKSTHRLRPRKVVYQRAGPTKAVFSKFRRFHTWSNTNNETEITSPPTRTQTKYCQPSLTKSGTTPRATTRWTVSKDAKNMVTTQPDLNMGPNASVVMLRTSMLPLRLQRPLIHGTLNIIPEAPCHRHMQIHNAMPFALAIANIPADPAID